MTHNAEKDADLLAEVLREHAYTYPDSFCSCGAYVGDHPWIKHAAHVADALLPLLAQVKATARAEALRGFADTRGVNIGDEDSEWWQGYRQAQRECVRDALDHARSLGGAR